MTILETRVYYILIAACSLFLCWQSEKTGRKWGALLAVLILSLVAGLRAHNVGVDTLLYKHGVEYFFLNNEISWQYSFSYGYGVFSKAILSLWNNYTFLLLVQSLMTNGLVMARLWDYRKEGSITFMLMVYLCTTYLMTLCIIVQHLAVAIVFYFSRYLNRGKPFIYCLGVLFASCLHASALVAIIPLLIRLMNFKKNTTGKSLIQAIALVLLTMLTVIVVNLLVENYSNYDNKARQSTVGLMVVAQVVVFITTLILCSFDTRIGSGRENLSIIQRIREGAPNALPLYVLSFPLSAASYVIDNAGRISYYFSIYGAPCYGIAVKHANKSKSVLLCSLILVLWFTVYAIYVFFLHDGLGIFPYAFFWN